MKPTLWSPRPTKRLAGFRSHKRNSGRWGRSGAWIAVPWLCFLALACALPAAEDPPPTTGAASPSTAAAAHSLPALVDLRSAFDQYGLSRSRQGSRPTCSAFTVAGALEFALAKRQGQGVRLSTEFLNWAANATCGATNDGGFFSDLWKGFAAYGICTDQALPYQRAFDPAKVPPPEALADAKTRLGLGLRFHWIKEWDVKTGLTDAHLIAIKRTLHDGWPVCGGLRWPKKEQWVDDVLQMCPPDAVRDGHSVLLVGYREEPAQPGGGVFIFRNTAKAGRDGFMPYVYAQAYMNDAAWIDCEARSDRPAAAAGSAPAGQHPPGALPDLPASSKQRVSGEDPPK